MASIFGHSIVGFTLAKVLDVHRAKLLVFFAIASAILPDFDVIAFYFDIPYTHPMGHRGFTHSIIFALLWAVILMFSFGKRNKGTWFWTIFLATISHGVLDAMTSGGKGVGFFIPLHNERFFFPFRDIKVSPIGVSDFFSEWGLQVLFSEFKFVFVPCFLVFVVSIFVKKIKRL